MSQIPPNPYDENPPQQRGTSANPPGQFLIFAVLVGAIVFAVSQLPESAADGTRPAPGLSSQDNDEPETEKFEKAAAAFSGSPLTEHPDLDSISVFLSELAVVADQTGSDEIKQLIDIDEIKQLIDIDEIKQLIDIDKYTREMRNSSFINGAVAFTSDREFAEICENRILGPVPFDEFSIYKIEETGYANEYVIYAITDGVDFACNPQRFWLTKHNGTWKLYDWEPLDYGIRDSYETAVPVGNAYGDAAYDAYVDYTNICEAFDEDMRFDAEQPLDYGRNKRRLTRMTRLPLPDYLKGELILEIAYRWEDLGDFDGEQNCLQMAGNPDRTPGILFELSDNEYSAGNYGKSLAWIERYENAVGSLEKSRQVVINCYTLMHETENEIASRIEMLQRFPDGANTTIHLSRIIVDGDESQIEAALNFADNHEDSVARYKQLVNNLENTCGITTHIQRLADSPTEFDGRIAYETRVAFETGEIEDAARRIRNLTNTDEFDPEEYTFANFAFRTLALEIADEQGDLTRAMDLYPHNSVAELGPARFYRRGR